MKALLQKLNFFPYLARPTSGPADLRHLWLLLYWPLFGLCFTFAERFYTPDSFYPIWCPLDDLIPFCELFVLPYLFWFVFLIGMHAYLLFRDADTFKKMMAYIMLTYSVSLIIYFLFPNCQLLRPESFARDNVLTRFMEGFYRFDTNTNVCPSLHVVGTLAVFFASLHVPRFSSRGWRCFFSLSALLICLSTVFLKQHSVLDILAALPICYIAYRLCYRPRRQKLKCNCA